MISIKIVDMNGQIIIETYLLDNDRSWEQVQNLIDRYGRDQVKLS